MVASSNWLRFQFTSTPYCLLNKYGNTISTFSVLIIFFWPLVILEGIVDRFLIESSSFSVPLNGLIFLREVRTLHTGKCYQDLKHVKGMFFVYNSSFSSLKSFTCNSLWHEISTILYSSNHIYSRNQINTNSKSVTILNQQTIILY